MRKLENWRTMPMPSYVVKELSLMVMRFMKLFQKNMVAAQRTRLTKSIYLGGHIGRMSHHSGINFRGIYNDERF